MNLEKEVVEDLSFLVETLKGETKREYRYNGSGGTIIGIHGGFAGWMKDGLRSFAKENNVSGVLMFLKNMTDGIDSYLPQLDKEVSRYENPVIVGCSSGGFIALRWVSRYNAWNRIKKIITLGTPFQGNWPIFKNLGQSFIDTAPGAELLKDVNSIRPPPGKVISLYASQDKYVPSPENLTLNWEKIITNAQSHGDLQSHQKWYKDILLKSI